MCLDGHCEHRVNPLDPGPDTGADHETAGAGGPGGALGRRGLLAAGIAGAAALTLAPVSFAQAADASSDGAPPSSGDVTRTITGLLPTGVADFVYLPVEVPQGVQKIAVSYSYDKPTVPAGTPANSCDIGVFDERGIALGSRGFRGWSGGFRTEFEISNSEATPGYLPGPVSAGTWHVVLGPYQVAPQGMNYQVQVTLTYGEPGPGVRPRLPAAARQGPRPRLVPRRLPPAHRLLRRQAPARRGRGRRPRRRAGLHGLHRPQHHLLARGVGPVRRPRPADHHRRGGHHPQRPLARPRPAARRVDRLALPLARRHVRPLRAPSAPQRRAGGARAHVLRLHRVPVEVRLRRRRRHRGVDRPVDVRRRARGQHLGPEAGRGGPHRRALAPRDGQQRRPQRPQRDRPAAQRRLRGRPGHRRDHGRDTRGPQLDRGVLGRRNWPSPPAGTGGRPASAAR